MIRRSVMTWIPLLAVCAGVVALGSRWSIGSSRPIRIGLLHSRTGAMAISERSMIDAEVLELERLNAQGGLLGRPIEWVIADGRSDWPTFAREARRLIQDEKVAVILGCWTSASRKSVRPIVEQYNHLLYYPMAYEGLERSPNIIYTGAAPNQQIIPTVKWSYDTLKARTFFLVGSDYVWPRCVNAIIKDYATSVGARVVGEEYVLFGGSAVAPVIARIKEAHPDVILSSVAGDTNVALYRELAAQGLGPGKIPVVSFGIAEDELRTLPVREMVGDYAAWNYFQSIDRPENLQFVREFKARYGPDRVVSDVMAAAANSVRLWAQAVEEAGTDAVAPVLRASLHQSLSAPEGIVSIDPETHHAWRPVSIGRIRADGQFDIVWTSRTSVRPIPYPPTRTHHDWDRFLGDLYRGWGNHWANPALETGTSASYRKEISSSTP